MADERTEERVTDGADDVSTADGAESGADGGSTADRESAVDEAEGDDEERGWFDKVVDVVLEVADLV